MKSIAILALLAPIGYAVPVPNQPTQSLAQAQVKINAAYEDSNLEQELKLFHQTDNLPSDDEESADEEDTLVMRKPGSEFSKIQDKEASSDSPSDDEQTIKGHSPLALKLHQKQAAEDSEDAAQDDETNEILNEDDEDPGFVQNTRGGVVSGLGQVAEEDEDELDEVINEEDAEGAENEEDPGFVQNTRGGVVSGLGQIDQEDDIDEEKEDLEDIIDEEDSDQE